MNPTVLALRSFLPYSMPWTAGVNCIECNFSLLVFWFLLCLISPAELHTYTLVLCDQTHFFSLALTPDHAKGQLFSVYKHTEKYF